MKFALRATRPVPRRQPFPKYSARLRLEAPRPGTLFEKLLHAETPDDPPIGSPQASRTLETCRGAKWHFENEETSAKPKAREPEKAAPNPAMRLALLQMSPFGVAAIPALLKHLRT